MSKKKITSIIVAIVFAAVSITALQFFFYPSPDSSPYARRKAIEEAQRFERKGNGLCTAVESPSKHTKSGATYGFSSGCIPDGWEVIRQ